MIIVSQDNSKIANFDNIVQIYITSAEDEDIWEIRYESVDSLYETLGEYKTEERAQKVLQKIIGKYREFTIKFDAYNNESERYELPKVFEMPEEWELL